MSNGELLSSGSYGPPVLRRRKLIVRTHRCPLAFTLQVHLSPEQANANNSVGRPGVELQGFFWQAAGDPFRIGPSSGLLGTGTFRNGRFPFPGSQSFPVACGGVPSRLLHGCRRRRGWIKEVMGNHRFGVRGLEKVRGE